MVAQPGAVAVRLPADRVGLTADRVGAGSPRVHAPHKRGQVLVDLATTIAAEVEAIADIDTLRRQGHAFGSVPSPPTAWRILDALTRVRLHRVERAGAKARAHVSGADAGPAANGVGCRWHRP